TGLPGRRALDETLERVTGQYAIAMVDVDHFKRFNDRFGHDIGDEALRMVASKLARTPGGGRAFRYGGEEFALLFLRKDAKQAAAHLETLRESVAAEPFTVRQPKRTKASKGSGKNKRGAGGGKRVKLTVSIGVSDYASADGAAEQVMKAADKKLYMAKRRGRNCVIC
ncbi:MAG: GGDEF domain-containing protein, partial [Myxococcales bacterium]|nr:GGDEF domain-containing protein [Myxococcales bacterium]